MKSSKYLPALREYRKLGKFQASRGERVLSSLFPNRGTGFPGGWASDRIEQTLHMKNWTYVAVDAICSKIASVVPNMAYVVDAPKPGVTTKAGRRFTASYGQDQYISDQGHSFLTIGALRSKALSVVKPHEELEPLENDHPLRRLMENPNPVDTSFDIAYELQMFEELCGVSYEWLCPNDWGQPAERWCIPSHWVWPRTGGGRYVTPDNPHATELIAYYEIRPWGGMGSAGMLRFPPEEVIMTRWKSPINKIDGYSKLAAIAQWIDSEESISKSRWSQFMNQARPELWVELGAGYEDPNDDRISRIEAKFAAKLQGEYNYGRPIITPPGAKLTPLSFSPTEMAYFESETQIRDMILSTFRVPPAVVGIVKDMTYGSILATLMAFCSFCINPRLAMRGLTYSKHLASRWNEGGRKVRIWWDDCVPADPDQVNKDIATDVTVYAITPNEVRAMRGRKAYRAGGDDPISQSAGGAMPFPLSTGEDLSDLARLIAPMTAAEGRQRSTSEEGEEELTRLTDEEAEATEGQRGEELPLYDNQGAEADTSADIEEPNQPPHKAIEIEKDFDEWEEVEEPRWTDTEGSGDGFILATEGANVATSPSLIALPDIRQTNRYGCGAASAMAVGRYFGVGPEELKEWEEALGTTSRKGTTPSAIVQYLMELGLQVTVSGGLTVDYLRQAWQAGYPVICPIQTPKDPEDVEEDTSGHYVVVVGLALGHVFVRDPAIPLTNPDNCTILPETAWEAAWHDRDTEGVEYDHFGIMVGPPVGGGTAETADIEPRPTVSPFPLMDLAAAWLVKEWQTLEPTKGSALALALAAAKLNKFPLPGTPSEILKRAREIRAREHPVLVSKLR